MAKKPTVEGLKSWYKSRGISSSVLSNEKSANAIIKAVAAAPLEERTMPYINAQDAGPIPASPGSQCYYIAGIQNVGTSTKSLFLTIFFGNPFSGDLSKAFAGKDANMPYITSGPIAVNKLDPDYPLLPIYFTAPAIMPAGAQTTIPRGDPKLAADCKPCMSRVGTAVLWRTDCANYLGFSDWPNDASVEVCDCRNFHIGIVSS